MQVLSDSIQSEADHILKKLSRARPLRVLIGTRALRQGMLVLGDQGFRGASSFVIAILLGRACGRAEYGLYTLLFSLLVTAEAFQAALICTPYVVQNPSKTSAERPLHLGNTLLIQAIMSVVTLLFGLCMLCTFTLSWTRELSAGTVPAFAAAYVAVLCREFIRQVLLADLRVGWNLLYGGLTHFSLISCSIWLALSQKLNSRSALQSMAVCSALPVLAALWQKRHSIQFDLRRLRWQLAENWNVGRWLVAQAVMTVVSGPLYSWVLASSKGAATVGLLGACLVPVSVLSPVVQALNAFLLPKASHAVQQGVAHVRRIVLLSTVTVGLTMSVIPITIGLFSDKIMDVLFAGKYSPSAWLVLFFALRTYIIMTFVPFAVGLIAFKKTYLTFKSEMISLILTVLIGLPMTCAFGVWGVACGFLLTRLFSRVYLALYFERCAKASLSEAHAIIPPMGGSIRHACTHV